MRVSSLTLRLLWLTLAAAAGLSLPGCIIVDHRHHEPPPREVIIEHR